MKIREWHNNLQIRLIGGFFTNASLWMIMPFMVMYYNQMLGGRITAILLMIISVVTAISYLFGGYLADRYGRYPMLRWSSFLYAIILFVFAISFFYHPLFTFGCAVLYYIVSGLYYPAAQAIIPDTVPDEKQTEVFSIFYSFANLSVVLGSFLGGLLIVTHRVELFMVASLFHLLVALAYMKWGHETCKPEQEQHVSSWRSIVREQLNSYRLIFTHKVFLLFMTACTIITLIAIQAESLLAIYIKELFPKGIALQLFDFSPLQLKAETIFSITIIENSILVVLFTVMVTKLIVRRLSERNVFVISSALYGASMLYLAFTANFVHLLIAILILTVGEMMSANLQMRFISRIAPDGLKAKYHAAATAQWSVAGAIAPLAILLSTQIGFTWTFFILALLAIVAAAFYYGVYQVEGSVTDGKH